MNLRLFSNPITYYTYAPPSLCLLSFDHITKYVVSNIEDFFAMCPSVLTESIRGTYNNNKIVVAVIV